MMTREKASRPTIFDRVNESNSDYFDNRRYYVHLRLKDWRVILKALEHYAEAQTGQLAPRKKKSVYSGIKGIIAKVSKGQEMV